MGRVYGGTEHAQKVTLPQKSQLTSSEEVLPELPKMDIKDLLQRFMNISVYIYIFCLINHALVVYKNVLNLGALFFFCSMNFEESTSANKELLFADYDPGYISRTSSTGYSRISSTGYSRTSSTGYSSGSFSVQSVWQSSSNIPGGSRGWSSRLHEELQ